MESENWYDKIDGYLDGTLSDAEKTDMDVAIAHDASLARAVRAYRMEREALASLSEEKARADFQRWTQRTDPATKPPVRRPWWRWPLWGAVAILLLVLAVWKLETTTPPSENRQTAPPSAIPQVTPSPTGPAIPNDQPKEQVPVAGADRKSQHKSALPPSTKLQKDTTDDQLPKSEENRYAAAYEKEARSLFTSPETIMVRGTKEQTAAEKRLAEGKKMYDSAASETDYQKVVIILEGTPVPGGDKTVATLYLKAHAYFKIRQFEKAASAFRDVANQDSPYKKDSKWKEALSLYAAGAKDKVRLKKILEEMKQMSIPPETKSAVNKMLEKLN